MKKGNALITGGAKRIGKAVALRLAEEGWNIALHYRTSQKEAEETAEAIHALGQRATLLPADLAMEGETALLMDRAREAMGPITLLVNNASTFYMDKLGDMTRRSWDEHLESNLRAPLVLSQAFAAQMEGQGNIINMLDQRVFKPTPFFFSYTIAKTGLWVATRTMALSLAPHIRVNGIGPGPTLPSPKQSPQQFADHCDAMPLRRGGSPEEVAQAVLFILNTPSMTGQMIALDGGEHLGWQIPAKGYQPKE